jgi:hypothetical protein
VADEPKTYSEEEYAAMVKERDALKANRDEILREAKKAKDALRAYDGVDPEEHRRLKEAADAADKKKAAAEGDFKALEKQLIDRHASELGVKDKRIDKLTKALERRLVQAELTGSLNRAELADPSMMDLLVDYGSKYVTMKETDDGFEQVVTDGRGNALVADGKGTPMTVDVFVEQTLKAKYPLAFKGTGSTGGGAAKSATSGGGAKVIAAGDQKAFIDNVKEIADGEVEVR